MAVDERVQRAVALPSLARLQASGRTAALLPLLAIVGVAFGVTAIFARSVHDYSVMPDELGYVKQAIGIAHTGFLVTPHSFYFASWSQLLQLISAPLFGELGSAEAFYVSHTLYALILASTGFPAYLITRELNLGRLEALLVSALSVAVPWLVIAGEVMTDVVAYPMFAWAALAILRTLSRPSARRDAIALAAIALAFFARTQFVVLGPILLVAVVVDELALSLAARGERSFAAAIGVGVRQAVGRHRLLWTCSVFAGLAVAMVAGSSHSLLGDYVAPLKGSLLPAGTFSAGVEQLDLVVLGIGVVPFILAAAWALATLARPRAPERLAFAVELAVLVPVFMVMVGSFQTRFMAAHPTDRYLFYLVPLLFAGAIVWIVERRASPIVVALICVPVAWMVLGVGLHPSGYATIINPSFNIHEVFVGRTDSIARALGLGHVDARVPIVVVVIAFTLAAVWLRGRLSPRRALAAVALPIFAYVLVNTGYAMVRLHNQLTRVPASHPAALAWIDRAVPSGARVGLLVAPTSTNQWESWNDLWGASFWNRTVDRTLALPGGDELAQGFVGGAGQDLIHGLLTGLGGLDYVVKLTSDPRLALRGPIVASPGDMALYRAEPSAPLVYGTSGVADFGQLEPGAHPFLRVFAAGGALSVQRVSVTLAVSSTAADCPCVLELGPRYGSVGLPGLAHPEVTFRRSIPVPARGYGQLDLDIVSAHGTPATQWFKLVSVKVSAARGARN